MTVDKLMWKETVSVLAINISMIQCVSNEKIKPNKSFVLAFNCVCDAYVPFSEYYLSFSCGGYSKIIIVCIVNVNVIELSK